MRKVIVSMNTTLDGFMAGPNGELDWHFPLWNTEMASVALEDLDDVDTILLGRRTYQPWKHTGQLRRLTAFHLK